MKKHLSPPSLINLRLNYAWTIHIHDSVCFHSFHLHLIHFHPITSSLCTTFLTVPFSVGFYSISLNKGIYTFLIDFLQGLIYPHQKPWAGICTDVESEPCILLNAFEYRTVELIHLIFYESDNFSTQKWTMTNCRVSGLLCGICLEILISVNLSSSSGAESTSQKVLQLSTFR